MRKVIMNGERGYSNQKLLFLYQAVNVFVSAVKL